MPAGNIDRAVKRGSGEIDGVNYEESQYEGYASGGVALLVETATDNRNRTAGDVRHIFTKFGGSLAEAGAVSYLFKLWGVILVERAAVAEDVLMETALEAGAEDVITEAETYEVLTPPGQLEAVKDALVARKVLVQSAELTKLSSLMVPVDESTANSVLKLIDALEDHDDVQKVYSNFSVTDEVLARLTR